MTIQNLKNTSKVFKPNLIRAIEIKLKSFDKTLLDNAANNLADSIKSAGAITSGPIMMPSKKLKLSIIKSVHIYKRHMRQFNRETYQRLIKVSELNSKVMDLFNSITLPSLIEINITPISNKSKKNKPL